MPFEAEISEHLKYGHLNFITVAVNNTLTPWTIPQGNFVTNTIFFYASHIPRLFVKTGVLQEKLCTTTIQCATPQGITNNYTILIFSTMLEFTVP